MDQEVHAPANNRRKVEEDKINQDQSSVVPGAHNNTNTKAVCLHDLTDDEWLLVFDYLGTADRTRIAGVCRRWRELARMSWKMTTRLSIPCKRYVALRDECCTPAWTETVLEVCLSQCGTRLRCLKLGYFCHSIYGCPLSSRAVDLIVRYCTSLQELHINDMLIDRTELERVAEGLPRLKSLSLEGDQSKIEEEALKRLPLLKSLNVADTIITGECFSQAPQSLTEICAYGCYELADNGVRLLAKRCPNLETIDISGCESLTGQSISDIANNCPKLKNFLFSHVVKVNLTSAYEYLTLSKLPLLEKLYLDNHTAVTDEVFYGLARHCPLLRHISCWGCHQLTDAAFSYLSSCCHMETINLGRTKVTDIGLIQLSSAGSELKKVYLYYSQGISDEGVGRLLWDHPNLLMLSLCKCKGVTDKVLPMIESSMQYRKRHTQPLEINLDDTSISPATKAITFGAWRVSNLNITLIK